VTAFDALAADYDASFTATPLGTLLREAVWRRLDGRFAPGDRVLELACGTGEDAIHLARRGVRVTALDASPAMVEVARRKVTAAGLEELIEVHQMDLDKLPPLPGEGWEMGEGGRGGEVGRGAGLVDGAFSNFGGLNCISDLRAVSNSLAHHLRPGAPLLLCIMGPLVPWEWIWYLGKGDPARAFRRLRRGGVTWRGLTVQYPSIRATRRALASEFWTVRIGAVGALLPPTYLEEWTRRHPRLLAALDRWERRLERMPPLPWLADHYLIELERRAA
jgi:SAM-dependent methyltransferase